MRGGENVFGKRLESLRKSAKLSQNEFGKKMGEKYGKDFELSQSVVSSYEKGIREPSDCRMYVNIADFFGVTTDYLLGVEKNKNTPLLDEVLLLMRAISDENLEELSNYIRYLKWKDQHL